MTTLRQIFESIRDGSFPIRLLNRFGRTRYVADSDAPLDDYLAEHYPGDGWKLLSPRAKQFWIELSPVFEHQEIRTIAYVGAHEGQTSLAIDDAFPGRSFVLIEPVPSTFKRLMENVQGRKNMKCCNLAAGSKEETRDMFVDHFSAASSLLPYEEIAILELPFLGRGKTVKVEIKPLDRILAEQGSDQVDLLVIDVQGYEDEVLKGALKTVKTCKVVMSELSVQPLYSGSSTFTSIHETLAHEGFSLEHLLHPLMGNSRRILQIDGIFIRK
jgi:FkbM family methyltransferase